MVLPMKVDHLQVTVKDIDLVEDFYDGFMEALGFDLSKKIKVYLEELDMNVIEYLDSSYDFGICSALSEYENETVHRRKPGAVHHIAFRAASRSEVDRIYQTVLTLGAEILDEPQIFPQHGPNYYALFFNDPDGIKYEIVNNDDHE
ncbi:VOC family protein [Enterococcus sp.]|uniref:VOC family protein n=1 Tax=Enterococcus sp. TaxID=35783 RepID=UPI002915BF7D|nr:VOC family protein [Enterococcus sp.]MDU5333626.1 VOC family protein [Enterococcus sp.]